MARQCIGEQYGYDKAGFSETIYQTVGPILPFHVVHSSIRSLD